LGKIVRLFGLWDARLVEEVEQVGDPEPIIGNVVFVYEAEEGSFHPQLPFPSVAGRDRRRYAALPPTIFPSDRASWITCPKVPPFTDVVLAGDHHVSRNAQFPDEPRESRRLAKVISNLGLDHQEIEVAVGLLLTSCEEPKRMTLALGPAASASAAPAMSIRSRDAMATR
jgi:hypothetical protein